MGRLRSSAWAALFAVPALLGCAGDTTRAPHAPGLDGSTRDARPGGSPTGSSDGGGRDGGPDGGAPALDGGVVGCVEVPGGDGANQLTVTQDHPTPFELRRAFVRWAHVGCLDPTLLVALTDGACEPGVGQQLSIAVARDDIGTNVTAGSTQLLAEEPGFVSVRFSRPTAGDPASRDVFGTCSAASVGSVTFEGIADGVATDQRGRFDAATLAGCTEATLGEEVVVTGRWDLILPVAFESICP